MRFPSQPELHSSRSSLLNIETDSLFIDVPLSFDYVKWLRGIFLYQMISLSLSLSLFHTKSRKCSSHSIFLSLNLFFETPVLLPLLPFTRKRKRSNKKLRNKLQKRGGRGGVIRYNSVRKMAKSKIKGKRWQYDIARDAGRKQSRRKKSEPSVCVFPFHDVATETENDGLYF